MNEFSCSRTRGEPVWPSGKALAEGPRFDSTSALLSLQKLWSVDTVFVVLFLTVNETLRWPISFHILLQESFWW